MLNAECRMLSEHLIIFTRYPEPGKTKSRLIPALGPQGAAEVQREMTLHTLCWAKELMGRHDVCVEVRFEGGDESLMRDRFGGELPYRPQGDGDLGERMVRAFSDAFRAGAGRAVIVGSDCPDLCAELVRTAFDRLVDHDLVLGPATDGGYYLIGLRGEVPRLFENVPWGAGGVLEQTLQVADRLGLSVAQLQPLADVDRPEDLHHLGTVPIFAQRKWDCPLRGAGSPLRVAVKEYSVDPQRISVIIPTLNEAACLAETLRPLQSASDVEIIVADAGSVDETAKVAEAHGAVVLRAASGRGRQMNAAAAAATGAFLLFLHADTRLPEHFDDHVRRVLGRPGVIAGAFRLRIDAAGRWLRLIERVANLRARYLPMPYGDQAMFLRRDAFQSVGGFPELPIMEDYELVRRLRRRGRIELADALAVASARRWQTLGPWRTTWLNQIIVLGYHLGVSPERLARWYRATGNCP
ncbi:MAG: TIGR04283 family arsenosugar biosynthesis glycosyltransferase [Planctomycetota bacterium]|jgi:rSAM/selenodomain-associated transferase 2/rSAM/selenodomain-associated transferase 1